MNSEPPDKHRSIKQCLKNVVRDPASQETILGVVHASHRITQGVGLPTTAVLFATILKSSGFYFDLKYLTEWSSTTLAASPIAVSSNQLRGEVQIDPGTDFEVPILCYEGCIVQWQFQTEGGDIGFGLTLENEDSKQIQPITRVDSHKREITGLYRVQSASDCTLTLRFSNAHSYFTSKLLRHNILLEEPLGGQTLGPRHNHHQSDFSPQVIFVLGGPGSGKGTNCSRLAKQFGFFHVSAGDLLREERANPQSEHGALISTCIREGKIVPVEITVRLLWRAIRESSRKYVLVDGFPRNADNLQGWRSYVGDKASVLGVLSFDAPDEVMIDRLLVRGESSGRDDDNLATIRKRLQVFHEETEPILLAFPPEARMRISVAREDAPDVVFDRTCIALRTKIPQFPALREFFSLGRQENRRASDGLPQRLDSYEGNYLVVDANITPSALARELHTSTSSTMTTLVLRYVSEMEDGAGLNQILEACDALHRQALFSQLGLREFPAWQVVYIYHTCESRGWLKPALYIARYSVLDRDVETELLPALHLLGIPFHAQAHAFAMPANNTTYAAALERLTRERFGMTCEEVSLCWLYYHSKLTGRDVVECGPELRAIMPLPHFLGVEWNRVWLEECKPVCSRYF